jgi:hypothetical protein
MIKKYLLTLCLKKTQEFFPYLHNKNLVLYGVFLFKILSAFSNALERIKPLKIANIKDNEIGQTKKIRLYFE